MFLPIGGIFVFGNAGNPVAAVVLGIFNVIMGAVTLSVGYGIHFVPLVVIGWIIASLGALMILLNLFKMRGRQRNESNLSDNNYSRVGEESAQ